MEVTYMLIVSVVAYILVAIYKLFIEKISSKFIPIQNVIVGIVSGVICYLAGIEQNLFNSIVVCLVASQAAGGVANLFQQDKTNEIMAIPDTKDVYDEAEVEINE